jgi:hypothetical protein
MAPLAQYVFILGLIWILIWRRYDADAVNLMGFVLGKTVVLLIATGIGAVLFLALYVVPYQVGARRSISWSEQLGAFEAKTMAAIVTALSRPATISRVLYLLNEVAAGIDAERKIINDREGLRAVQGFVATVDERLKASEAASNAPALTQPPVTDLNLLKRNLLAETLQTDLRYLHVVQLDEISRDLTEIREQLSRSDVKEAPIERLGASYSRVQAQQMPRSVTAGQRKPHLIITAGMVISLLTPIATKFENDSLSWLIEHARRVLGF